MTNANQAQLCTNFESAAVQYVGSATYSPEDNKLRLYPSKRLDSETYDRVKAAGFSWAPRQELFVAPAWSPSRESLLIELCGDIEAECMTMAERAEIKAQRLTGYAEKRLQERNAYHRAADHYSERFAFGQPILVGHHSEQSARVAQKRVESAMNQAARKEQIAATHLYRATSAQLHANRKNNDGVRARRIQTLLSDYRDKCRLEREYKSHLKVWQMCTTQDQVVNIARVTAPMGWEASQALKDNPETWEAVRTQRIAAYERALAAGALVHRWKAHILARLGYERELLGDVPRFAGKVTPGVVQVFARAWGVDGPKGVKDGDEIGLTADDDLPGFMSDLPAGLTLSADGWRDLFQSLGYEPPVKVHTKTGKAALPLLNIDAETVTVKGRYHREENQTLEVVRVSKADYAKLHNDYKGTDTSACGLYRVRMAMRNALPGFGGKYGRVGVFLTDQKASPIPTPLDAAQ